MNENQASQNAVDHPDLERLARDTDALSAAASRLFERCSPAQLGWKPDAGTWSIVQIFDHLYVAGSLYYPRIEAAIRRSRQEGFTDPASIRPGWVGRLSIRLIRPDSGRKFKVPGRFRPAAEASDVSVLPRYLEQVDQFKDLIRQADGVSLNRLKFGTPVTRLLRFTIGEGLTLMLLHQQRHLGQAERLLETPGFPRV